MTHEPIFDGQLFRKCFKGSLRLEKLTDLDSKGIKRNAT